MAAPQDPRTKAQRRADGLVQICADYLDGKLSSGVKIKKDAAAVAAREGPQAPRYHGLRPQIHVSVALSCRAPGCERPTAKADLHHVQWWSRGGPTNAADLIPACESHHYPVHDGGSEVTRKANGTVVWTSTAGHTYRVPPATYPIDNTAQIKKDTPERLRSDGQVEVR